MKNIKAFLLFFLSAGMILTSCTKDEDVNTFFQIDTKGAVSVISGVTGFFDIANPAGPGVTFTVASKGETVSSIDVFKSVKGSAEVLMTNISSFPSSLSVDFNQVLEGTGVVAEDLSPGDQAVFRTVVNAVSGTYPGKSVSFNFSCSSDLSGMMDVSTVGWCGETFTGTAEMVETGDGTYTFTDMSFGAYEVCYGPGSALPEGDLEIVDICNMLSYTGVSQWGETYEFLNMTVNGPTLTFDWKNDYDPEAGKTTLTRQDGKDWPNLTF
jgi:hypothetical protein